MQDVTMIVELAVGLALPLGGFVFSLWKWDARRIEERAKDRQHELELARIRAEQEHQQEVKTLQGQVIHLQQVVEERLFKALDDAREAKNNVADAQARLIQTVQNASLAEMEAIRALSGDVASLKTQLPAQYEEILRQMGEVLDQSRRVHLTLGDLVGKVAAYHHSVENALSTNQGAPLVSDSGPSNGGPETVEES